MEDDAAPQEAEVVVDDDVVTTEAVAGEVIVGDNVVDEEVVNEETADEEAADGKFVDEESVDEEIADEESVDEELVDEETVDEELVDEEAADEEVVDEEAIPGEAIPYNSSINQPTLEEFSPPKETIAASERPQSDVSPSSLAAETNLEEPYNTSSIKTPQLNYVVECSIGLHPLNNKNSLKRQLTSNCEHELEVCVGCLSEYLAAQITEKAPNQIECPTCNQHLDSSAFRDFADRTTFEKYDKMLLNQYLNNELGTVEKFQECRNPECGSGQICHPNKDSYIMCRDCEAKTCIECDALWHPEQSCEERRAATNSREDENAKGQEFVDTNCKRCPKCTLPGIKDGGCDHITCPQCKYEFCWGCLADYNEIRSRDNREHGAECPYYSENLPNPPEGVDDEEIYD